MYTCILLKENQYDHLNQKQIMSLLQIKHDNASYGHKTMFIRRVSNYYYEKSVP